MWLLLLRQEALSIQGLGNNAITLVSGNPGSGSGLVCPGIGQKGFGWINSMPAANNKMSKTAFALTDSNVIVGADLYDGSLFTSAFPHSHINSNKVLAWYWDNEAGTGGGPGGQMERPIAEEISFSKQWDATVTSVTLQLMAGGVLTGQVTLQPDGNGQIHVWLVNLPLIDIFVNRSAWSQKERAAEHHFHHYYRLAAAAALDRIPWPDPNLTNSCAPPFSGVANPRCPPVLFDSVSST
jgi:hypothetical protein